jgi:hypothetical protein
MSNAIHRYDYGQPKVSKSPVSMEELELMKKTVLFTDEDVRYLRMSRDVRKSDGQPESAYLEGVRKRFGQWVLDTTAADYDQRWLD